MSRSDPAISVGSHVTEPANTYVDLIEPKWRDRAAALVGARA